MCNPAQARPCLPGLRPMHGFIFCIPSFLIVMNHCTRLQWQRMVWISVVRYLLAMFLACSFTLKKVTVLAPSC